MKDHKIAFVSLSSGIIARNLISIPEAFLTELQKKFATVVFFVPSNTLDFYKKNYGAENLVFIGVTESICQEESKNFIQRLFAFFYTHLLFAENAKSLAWEGVYLNVRPKSTISGWFSYPLKWLIGYTFGRSNFVRLKIVPFLLNFTHTKKYFVGDFEYYKPAVVFVPNIENWQDISLIREAKANGVPTVGMPGSWDHLPKRFRPIQPDKLLVGTYTQKQEAIYYQSYKPENISVVGVPYFDAFVKKDILLDRESFLLAQGLDPNKKTIFFSSESIYAPDEGEITKIIYDAIKNDELPCDCQLFVRPYPGVKKEHDKFDYLNGKEDVFVDWIENHLNRENQGDAWYPNFRDIVHFVNSIYHADILINTYSSITIEAAFFNKSVIGINFDGYHHKPDDVSVRRFRKKTHIKNIIETGAVTYVNSGDELIVEINKQLLQNCADRFVSVLKHKMCGPTDGKTGMRLVHKLVEYSKY